MKAIARITSHMDGYPDDIWIAKGKIYDLERVNDPEPDLYFFIDEQGDEHHVEANDFDKYFKEVG